MTTNHGMRTTPQDPIKEAQYGHARAVDQRSGLGQGCDSEVEADAIEARVPTSPGGHPARSNVPDPPVNNGPRTTLPAAASAEVCAHADQHFDRSLCACGAMHTYCNDCGINLDECPYEETATAASAEEGT